ncbi:MAG: hypothetical protein P1V51_14300 [Deltaproteobacteria bacterium]|nr:hypothetical protein [Deltaproteobacteria bacterium]
MAIQRNDDRLHDKRLIERFLRDGTVVDKDHEKYLSKLPDLEKEAEVIGVALESVGDRSGE